MVIEILIVFVVVWIGWICVGLGGVMLFNYLLLKVVENFMSLEVLFLGCIDFGLGCVFGIDGCMVLVLWCLWEVLVVDDFFI